ncbi:hypothetical protein [Umezawaea sp. NPDC059074]|uniref:hypothetical protein n=1 Tax=Umezawaea sp. NPDC059074 TaxID=3346716 RepID=UPI00367EC046
MLAANQGVDLDGGVDQLTGFVRQQRDRPTWAAEGSEFEDTVHRLTVALRRRKLVAVHCDNSAQNRLQRWLDKPPRPEFIRIPPRVLEGALHRGDAKSLWTRGVHRPRTTKADTKSTGGQRLQDTANPAADGTYTVGAARSELPDDPNRVVLNGIIGSSLAESSAWFKPSPDFPTFVTAVVELLDLIENELAHGSGEEVFANFAREVFSLDNVKGAYEIRVVPSDDLPSHTPDSVCEAAVLLQDAVLDLTGASNSPRIFLDVGLAGSTSGQLKGTPKPAPHGFSLDIGFGGTPTNPGPVRQVLDALHQGESLLSVYYSSGHTIVNGRIWEERPRDFAFPNWSFEDFSGYALEQEKPPFKGSQDIHDKTATQGDRSLFAWVVNRYQDGWLTCDDGAGEIADFLHISPEGTLSLIHVKAANSCAPSRRVAVAPYEVVVSQAVKNLVFTDRRRLLKALSPPRVSRPACWDLGVRTASRTEFLEALEILDATSPIRIVIVQPHVSKQIHDRARGKNGGATTEDRLRLRLLDELLNSARSTVTEVATDLTVIGSLI